MYNNEKIGVGITTYNREESFVKLFNQIKSIDYIDYIVIIKNKDIEYSSIDFSSIESDNIKYHNILGDVGIAVCKNTALIDLLNFQCDHLFILEDDMIIKNSDVFKKYIDTSKFFNIGHLNWNTLPAVKNNKVFVLKTPDISLCTTSRLCGCFQYFERNALLHVGLINEKYVNLLEHAEHAYRFSLMEYTTPFNSFADIENGYEYLENIGEDSSTISRDGIYSERAIQAVSLFKSTYGILMKSIPIPSTEKIKSFVIKKIQQKD